MRKFLIPLAVIAVGVFAFAGPANADHSGNPNTENLEHVTTSGSGPEDECGKATIILTVPEGTPSTWKYGLTVEVNDKVDGFVVQTGPGTASFPLSFEEDKGDGLANVKYYFTDATEWDLVAIDMNYQSTYPDEIKFRSFDVDTDCIEPTPEPTASSAPSPTPTASATSSPESGGQAGGDDTDKPGLPVTGSPVAWLGGIGAGLVTAGGLAYLLTRNRRNIPTEQ